MQKGIVRTKMAAALIGAIHQSIDDGNNTGRLGRRVLTNEAAGVGVKFIPRTKPKPPAVSAVMTNTIPVRRDATTVDSKEAA